MHDRNEVRTGHHAVSDIDGKHRRNDGRIDHAEPSARQHGLWRFSVSANSRTPRWRAARCAPPSERPPEAPRSSRPGLIWRYLCFRVFQSVAVYESKRRSDRQRSPTAYTRDAAAGAGSEKIRLAQRRERADANGGLTLE